MFLLKKPVKDYFPLTPLNSYIIYSESRNRINAVRSGLVSEVKP